jgi:putative NADPH-quinone reductase
MRAHFVLAHPETESFNAHLARSGADALKAAGWTVSESDLYAMASTLVSVPSISPIASLRRALTRRPNNDMLPKSARCRAR